MILRDQILIEVSRDGSSFTSTGTTDIFDAGGTLIATRCSTGMATRVDWRAR